MSKLRLSRGFTLLETLVALAVVVTVLVATTTANRVISASAQGSEELTQMSALASETANQLALLQQYQRSVSATLGAADALNVAAGGTGELMAYADTLPTYGSPVQIRWCSRTPPAPCQTQQSAVQTTTPLTIAQMFTTLGGELIAVRRSSSQGPQVVHMASRVNGMIPIDTSSQDWDFYVRSIGVQRLSGPAQRFGLDIGPANQPNAAAATYLVTVTVRKYVGGTVQPVKRTITLTDY